MVGASKINRKDYKPSAYLINTVDLDFSLDPKETIVKSKLQITRNTEKKHSENLILNGEGLTLLEVKLNDQLLEPSNYTLTEKTLEIPNCPSDFTLEITHKINPEANTLLSGLYYRHNIFCTQCEAEGFRRITYFLDRPDVLAKYTTTITADKSQYPVLLSNGNLLEQGDLPDNKHWAKWQDPFKKPCYLFALVAADLGCIEDSFTTLSNRVVTLHIFVEKGKESQAYHAMTSLKKAMKWDEETYGREYDLDLFMIVAVNDFNSGAMENKGLNIFNDKYILVDEKTATDDDFEHVETVVAHEYFHNWTGNRVTCRDWFQLSLKEGLTVFREQQFSEDLQSPTVKRIASVQSLRSHQFPEDAGPLSHPVRPESYLEINNFYTTTIYEKGAEVIRMQNTLLGKAGFRKGMDLYFERHDGQAVTIEDFVKAQEDANGVDLTDFKRWYSQPGTPEVVISGEFSQKEGVFRLKVSQNGEILPIPLEIGLIDDSGGEMGLILETPNFL